VKAPRFAAAATRLAGLAGVLFGWRPHEFWAATPAELAAMVSALVGHGDAPPPDARQIAQMMEAFPDG